VPVQAVRCSPEAARAVLRDRAASRRFGIEERHMNSVSVPGTAGAMVHAVSATRGRHFFVVLAVLMALIVFVGFAPTFYLRALFGAPALSSLLVLHGIVFSAWLGLLIAQTLLIRAAQIRIHRVLGIAGALLAIAMVLLGAKVAFVGAAQGTLGARSGVPPLEFLIVPLGQVVLFAALMAGAIALRRRPAAHKRLVIVATIQLVAPAAVRAADVLFHIATPLSGLVVLGMLLAACIGFDLVTRGRVHPVLAVVGPLTLLSFPLRIAFSHTAAWHAAAQWLVHGGAGT
jgi:hypothetical protein